MSVAFRVMLAVGLTLIPSVTLYAQETTSTATTQPVVYAPVHNLSPAYDQHSRLPAFGKAMFYNPGVMETVLENRLEAGTVDHCRECVGYVAMLRVGDLNRRVWIQLPDGTVEGPFHVIDAADQKHVRMLLNKGWVIDVDYETAMRWKMAGPRPVTIWAEPPNRYRVTHKIATDREYEVDIYRHEKLDYFNQPHEYSGYVETMYVQ